MTVCSTMFVGITDGHEVGMLGYPHDRIVAWGGDGDVYGVITA